MWQCLHRPDLLTCMHCHCHNVGDQQWPGQWSISQNISLSLIRTLSCSLWPGSGSLMISGYLMNKNVLLSDTFIRTNMIFTALRVNTFLSRPRNKCEEWCHGVISALLLWRVVRSDTKYVICKTTLNYLLSPCQCLQTQHYRVSDIVSTNPVIRSRRGFIMRHYQALLLPSPSEAHWPVITF